MTATLSFRPRTTAERARALDAVAAWEADGPPEVAILSQSLLAKAAARYHALRDTWHAAEDHARLTAESADAADEAFDLSYRALANEVDATTLTEAAGVAAAALTQLPYKEEVERARRVLQASLGSEGTRGLVRACTEALASATQVDEEAAAHLRQVGAALSEATRELDRAYARLVRALREVAGEAETSTRLAHFYGSEP